MGSEERLLLDSGLCLGASYDFNLLFVADFVLLELLKLTLL